MIVEVALMILEVVMVVIDRGVSDVIMVVMVEAMVVIVVV